MPGGPPDPPHRSAGRAIPVRWGIGLVQRGRSPLLVVPACIGLTSSLVHRHSTSISLSSSYRDKAGPSEEDKSDQRSILFVEPIANFGLAIRVLWELIERLATANHPPTPAAGQGETGHRGMDHAAGSPPSAMRMTRVFTK